LKGSVPLIKQLTDNPLENEMVLGVGSATLTVVSASAVIVKG
jgi:hypothetical protein